jgi:hypothetical protein
MNKFFLVVMMLCFLHFVAEAGRVKRIDYTGTSVRVIVSGSIRGTGGGNLSQEDPIAGVLVWYVSNGEDGSMADAKILRGTTYYKPNPDTLDFTSNSAQHFLLVCGITDSIADTNAYVSRFYTVKVNGATYQIGFDNVVEVAIPPIGPVTAVNESPSGIPALFAMMQNYPNPFNPSTTIEYQLPSRGNVQINIYNSLGQVVRSLVNEQREAGSHFVVWDGRDNEGNAVSTGAYFYQVQVGEFVQAKRMLMLK